MALVTSSETSKDTNSTATVTTGLDISAQQFVAMAVLATTGTHTTHEVELQCSVDNTSWFATGMKITGTGLKDGISVAARYVRLKVTIAEGTTSTVTLVIQAK